MKIPNFFKQYLSNRAILVTTLLSLATNVLTWVYLFTKFKPQSEPIFVHYNIYYGVDLIGNWYYIFAFPLIGIIIFIINSIVSMYLFKKSNILSYMIVGILLLLQLIILVSSLVTTRINV